MIALLTFLLPLAYSPGPGNIFFAVNAARFGVRATLAANLGYHIATLIVTYLIGSGFASISAIAPEFMVAIRWAGGIFVFYLAYQFFRAGDQEHHQNVKPPSFWTGVLLLLLNSKAYLIIALMFSQFMNASDGPYRIAEITVIFTLNNFVAFLLWSFLGEQIMARLSAQGRTRMMNNIFGGILSLVAICLLLA